MKLEDISAEIRPRYDWEAVDLGWALARQNFGKLLRGWVVAVFPLWALILFLLRDHLLWAMVVIWWLKPIYERVPLFILSQVLFGSTPRMGDLLKALPGLYFRNLFHALLIGRLSMQRSVVLPIAQLERARGRTFYNRAQLITRRTHGATVMQFSCLAILHATWIGIALLIYMMIPNPGVIGFWEMMGRILYEKYLFPYTIYGWIALYLSALTLMTQFYVGGGFAMYLNSRTQIEGWDVELSFRRMAERVRTLMGSAATLLVAFLVFAGGAESVRAAEETPSPKDAIGEVMEHPDFEIQTQTFRFPKDTSTSVRGPSLDLGLGQLVQSLFWVLFVVLAVFLLIMLVRYLMSIQGGAKSRAAKPVAPKARSVMGMNVEKESLPADVVGAARKLWAEGNHQEAVGLLYRGAISWLIEVANVPIEESDTEVECMQRTGGLQQPSLVSYFSQLTRAWIRTAYGDQPPDDQEVAQLFEQWPFRAGALREGAA